MSSNTSRFGVPRQITGKQSVARVAGGSNIPQIHYSTGVGKLLGDFSDMLFRSSDGVENQLDQQAVAEGQVEGATAGATGEFETRDYLTLRNRAYNKAGIEAFVTTLETRSILKMKELQSLHGSDPVGLQTALNNYHEGVGAELDKVSPGAGAAYRQRQTIRTIPAIEAARDTAFAATKEQAEVALVENQVAIQAELNAVASDLFSENPVLSQAAAQSVSLLGQNLMRIYEAVDPATGRPLYTHLQRAEALKSFQQQVFRTATQAWFEGQDDKAGAYTDFMSGDFKIDLNIGVTQANIIDANFNKIRNLPVSAKVGRQISTSVAATDPNLSVMLVSGGQPEPGHGPRTGSTRHDHGNSADIVLVRDGQPVTPEQDPELYARFLENAAASGFTGIGHYDWGIHVGGGSVAAWGPNKSASSLDPVFGAAIERGRANPIDTEASNQRIDVRQVLTPKQIEALESDMRSSITFSNRMADRAEAQEAEELQARQDVRLFELTDRLLNGGKDDGHGHTIPALTRDDVMVDMAIRAISTKQGESLIRAMAQPKPKASDPQVYTDMLARLYDGENIYDQVIANSASLSAADQSSLLAKNQSLNVSGEGSMSPDQTFYFNSLKDVLTPDGFMAKFDQHAEARKFSALDEYRNRIFEGESPRDVANELQERAIVDQKNFTNTRIDSMVRPRFSVPSQTPGRIDIEASRLALLAAKESGQISETSLRRQVKLLMEWNELQKALE